MQKLARQAYQDWAATYDDEINPSIDLEQAKVVRLMNIEKKDEILDVGCGTGRYAQLFAKQGAHVTGMDFSPNMLKMAKSKVKNASFRQADITKRFPFQDKKFDKIICSLVVSHIKHPYSMLSEMKRVIKDDGFIILTTLHPKVNFDGFELVKFNFPLSAYNCSIIHSFKSFESLFKKSKLREEKRIELYIDNSIKHCFSKESFKKVKGRPKGVVFKLVKER
jgi:ubiquinone/menaquinone biosynthesis C-methylase UbiE